MRALAKFLVGLFAIPGMLIGFAYEFIFESFRAGQQWYARFMENLVEWVEGD
jgi:hypothetical protein